MTIDFDKFKNATRYDIHAFLQRYSDFVDSDYRFVVSYYQGGALNQASFKELDELLKEVSVINPLWELYSSRLNTVDMWELLDLFEEVSTKLDTCKNMGKWQRSSRLGTQDSNVKIDRILSQRSSLEQVASELGYSDAQNNWKEIAIGNQIEEEGYTDEGGTMFSITLKNNFNFDIPNIIAPLTFNALYGKDINRKITYENNDLNLILDGENISQNFKIKLSTIKGSIPEFAQDGISSDLIGVSQSVVQYPTIIRDVLALFKKDARWTEVNLVDIFLEQESVLMKIQCKTVKNDDFATNLAI